MVSHVQKSNGRSRGQLRMQSLGTSTISWLLCLLFHSGEIRGQEESN
uniref:Uncharacterized protein n=1 Tax=Brassica campestris TaxID=3711 RepID=A0A3P6AHJ9_BRACM|nr:unnamed protein product [Brassica rapa]